jgi:NAD(P)-dependent dehydrogenase (short-subunit alcohol dehydrogenase family)
VASKHGVIGLTKTVAKEVGQKGIRVNAVAPYVFLFFPYHNFIFNLNSPLNLITYSIQYSVLRGVIETPMSSGINSAVATATPLARQGQPEEVAKLIAFLLSEDSSFITGSIYPIDGGFLS